MLLQERRHRHHHILEVYLSKRLWYLNFSLSSHALSCRCRFGDWIYSYVFSRINLSKISEITKSVFSTVPDDFSCVFLSVVLSLCLPSFLCLCTSHCEDIQFFCLLSDTALIYEQTQAKSETPNEGWGITLRNNWNDQTENIYLSWYSMRWVSVLLLHCMIVNTQCRLWWLLWTHQYGPRKIISKQIMAKGDFV